MYIMPKFKFTKSTGQVCYCKAENEQQVWGIMVDYRNGIVEDVFTVVAVEQVSEAEWAVAKENGFNA